MRRPRPRHLLRDFRPRYAALLKVPGQRGRQAMGDAVSIHARAASKICSEWKNTIPAQKIFSHLLPDMLIWGGPGIHSHLGDLLKIKLKP